MTDLSAFLPSRYWVYILPPLYTGIGTAEDEQRRADIVACCSTAAEQQKLTALLKSPQHNTPSPEAMTTSEDPRAHLVAIWLFALVSPYREMHDDEVEVL